MTRSGLTIALATLLSAVPVYGQGRTDVVTLANGDHITGEVVRLERGRLEFKTDDAGTLYFEWDKIASLVANRFVEVLTSDGQRYLGTLGSSSARSISVVSLGGPLSLPMARSTWATTTRGRAASPSSISIRIPCTGGRLLRSA